MAPEGALGAGVSDDPARRNALPETRCHLGNHAPLRQQQMKWPCWHRFLKKT